MLYSYLNVLMCQIPNMQILQKKKILRKWKMTRGGMLNLKALY